MKTLLQPCYPGPGLSVNTVDQLSFGIVKCDGASTVSEVPLIGSMELHVFDQLKNLSATADFMMSFHKHPGDYSKWFIRGKWIIKILQLFDQSQRGRCARNDKIVGSAIP